MRASDARSPAAYVVIPSVLILAPRFVGSIFSPQPGGLLVRNHHTHETGTAELRRSNQGASAYRRDKTRNPKQCQMSQIENSKRASFQAVHFRDLEIRILNLFRISKFELRISNGKLDHFVTFVVTKQT